MSIIRWNSHRELTSWPPDFLGLQRDINSFFGNIFSGSTLEDSGFASMWSPAVDVVERDGDFVVSLELPGVNKDDVKITVDSNILTVGGEKNSEKETDEKNFHRSERVYGSFQRSFTFPTTVRSDRVDAVYRDGILTVTLPKAEEAKPKQIEVKVK